MSDETAAVVAQQGAEEPTLASDSGSEWTGVPPVDRVLAAVESVTTLPVAQRVAVFERAHEDLRRALDADPTADVAGR